MEQAGQGKSCAPGNRIEHQPDQRGGQVPHHDLLFGRWARPCQAIDRSSSLSATTEHRGQWLLASRFSHRKDDSAAARRRMTVGHQICKPPTDAYKPRSLHFNADGASAGRSWEWCRASSEPFRSDQPRNLPGTCSGEHVMLPHPEMLPISHLLLKLVGLVAQNGCYF